MHESLKTLGGMSERVSRVTGKEQKIEFLTIPMRKTT